MAPILAITVVIGTNIKKAGIFINPKLRGISAFNIMPDVKKPIEPNKAITKPMAAELPIAKLIG